MTTVNVLNNSGFDLIDAAGTGLNDGKTGSYPVSITPVSFYYKDDTAKTKVVTAVTVTSQKAVIIYDTGTTVLAGVVNSATEAYVGKFSVVKGAQTQFTPSMTVIGDWVSFVKGDETHKVKPPSSGMSSTWIWILLIVIVIIVVVAGGGVYWKYFHKKT